MATCGESVLAPAKEDGTCLLVQLSSNSRHLYFSTASDYLRHLLTHGECYAGARVEPCGPAASKLRVEQPLPPLESLSLGEETKFFSPTASQPSTRKRSTDILHVEGQDLSGHLLYALCHGLVHAAQQVIEASKDTSLDLSSPLQCANYQGLTPLAIAALLPSTQCLELLLAKDVAVDGTDNHGCTALHWAVLGGRTGSLKTLLRHFSADTISSHDEQGFTPLLYAAMTGVHDIAAMLLKAGASPNLPHYSTGATPLSLACLHGHPDIVKLLLKHRASTAVHDSQGCSALHCAAWTGCAKTAKLLLSHSPSLVAGTDQSGRTPLHYATARGDVVMCQLLLKRGAQLSEVDSAGRTTLHWAVLSLQPSCVEYLFAAPSTNAALRNQPDSHGATPTHYAAMTGKCDMLSSLVNKGVSTTVTDASGYSPLFWASASGNVDTTRQLLELINRGTSSLDGTGSPPLQDGSDDPSSCEEDACSPAVDDMLLPLHVACTVGALSVCQLLIQTSTTTARRDEDGRTALHCASLHGHTECLQAVLEAGVAPDSATHTDHRTSLHVASEWGHCEVVSRLLGAGASPDCATHPEGERPIHLAAHSGHANVLQELLNHGYAPDVRRANDGHTALLVAAEAGHLQCCKLLILRGADPGIKETTVESCTALDLALVRGHREVADYLISRGAPSGGGVFHRAALTIQAVWRLHQHRRRCRSREQWSAVMIQRAVRRWRGRRAAGRVRAVRERARNSAAATIQGRWRQYMEGRRRYEATSARLRARLHQEHLAASLLLEELQCQAHSIQLPPSTTPCPPSRTAPLSSPLPQTHTAPTPGYLLQASAPLPAPLISSASLLFPSRPRKPLTPKPHPRFATHQNRLASPLATISEHQHHHLQQQPEVQVEDDAERTSDAPVDCTHNSTLPTLAPQSLMSIGGSAIMTRDPSSFTASSLRGSSQLVTTGSPHSRERTTPSRREGAVDSGHVCGGSSRILPAIPSGTANLVTAGRDRESSDVSLESKQDEEQSHAPNFPPLPCTTSPPSLTSPPSHVHHHEEVVADIATTTDGGRSPATDTKSTSKEEKEDSEAVDSERLKCVNSSATTLHRAYMRQSMFPAAPLGQQTRQQGQGRAVQVDSRLLGHIRRYDRLNHILSLLQHVQGGEREGGEGEGGGEERGERVKLSELREQIRTTLDEAVRLRADTESLQHSTEIKLMPN